MNADPRWREAVRNDSARQQRAERERPGLLRQTFYLGTLGLVFVLPLIAAVYAGRWIDEHLPGYSLRGTLGGLAVGLLFGAVNVYLLLRRDEP